MKAMSQSKYVLTHLDLNQFTLAPSQVWGNIRLVPVIRKPDSAAPEEKAKLRLGLRSYDEPYSIVALDGKPSLQDTSTCYYSYIPHAMVATWSNDGQPHAAQGCYLKQSKKKQSDNMVRLEYRMAKREGLNQYRFLPLHLAMEGFLSICFNGPNVAWGEYTDSALRFGLQQRSERSVNGRCIDGLEEALRVFEIHPNQIGMVVFVADSLASIFIVSHPLDYRVMHQSLLEDFYGEILFYYGATDYTAPDLLDAINNDLAEDLEIQKVEDLHKIVDTARQSWQKEQTGLMQEIIGRQIESKVVNRLGPFRLQRFTTDFDPAKTNYIGEALVRKDGSIEYLKTFNLSRAQTNRVRLLKTLADHDWHLEQTAKTLECTKGDLLKRLDHAGFGYLIKQHLMNPSAHRKN